MKDCMECENHIKHRIKLVDLELCKLGGCADHPANSGHPLCPCVLLDCEDEYGERECDTDEIAIIEGGRCHLYILWLNTMHRLNDVANNCTYPFCKECTNRKPHPERTDLFICTRDGWKYCGWEVSGKTEKEYLQTKSLY